MKTTLARLEFSVEIALLLLGIFAAWQAAGMPQGTPALPGPGMVPMALGVLLAVCAVGLIVRTMRTGEAGREPIVLGHRHITLMVVATVVTGFIFEPLGFLLTSTLLLFVLMWALSPLGWWRALLAGFLASVAAQLFFQNLLDVVLPPLPFVMPS